MECFDVQGNGFCTSSGFCQEVGFCQFLVDVIAVEVLLQQYDGGVYLGKCPVIRFASPEVCKEIRAANPAIPILMLTALGSTDDKLDGFDAGADDYMVKPFDFRELYARIRVLLKRKLAVVTDVEEELNYADLSVNLLDKSVKRAGRDIKLSPKEYNLLVYMIENAEKVVSRMDIADKVWNTHFDTGTNFIDVYINYLRKKIDRDFDTKLIHTKTGMGFILTDKL